MGVFSDMTEMLGGISREAGLSALFNWVRAVSLTLDGTTTTTLAAQFIAKNVQTTNVANLAAYTVTSSANNDNVANVAGDVVLLVGQTTAAQNGPYVVGTVSGTTAPLTRPSWWSSGTVLKTGKGVQLGSQGSTYKNTTWLAMRSGGDTFTVDTDDPQLYPQEVSFQIALVGGSTGAISAPIRSLKTGVAISRTTANTSAATVMYAATVGGATGLVAGAIGTGSLTVEACVAAGTKNAADISTLNITIFNQAA